MQDRRKQKLVLERIERLFELAEKNMEGHPERSLRYIQMIRKLSMRHNIRLPRKIRRRFCSKCHAFIIPGRNARIRTNQSQQALIVTCLECGNMMRYPYRREKSINKNKKTNIK